MINCTSLKNMASIYFDSGEEVAKNSLQNEYDLKSIREVAIGKIAVARGLYAACEDVEGINVCDEYLKILLALIKVYSDCEFESWLEFGAGKADYFVMLDNSRKSLIYKKNYSEDPIIDEVKRKFNLR